MMLSDDGVESMDTLDTQWTWSFMADCGRWHRFEDDTDQDLTSWDVERYYRTEVVVIRRSSSTDIRLDFSAMLLTDLSTGKMKKIQRGVNVKKSCSCFSAAPDFWEEVDPTHTYQLMPVKKFTPEYRTVYSYMTTVGLLNRPTVSIQRIQNIDLWEIFCRKRKHLMRIKGARDIEERWLFHGTHPENIKSICMHNFDLRLARPEGLWGKGIYFAKHASRADKFSRRCPQRGTKFLFLARVLTGTPTLGNKEFVKPDHGKYENIHDSCVDNINSPRNFVIFDPNQIYPEYLVEYRGRQDLT